MRRLLSAIWRRIDRRMDKGPPTIAAMHIAFIAFVGVSAIAISVGIFAGITSQSAYSDCRDQCADAGHFESSVRDGECWCSTETWVRPGVVGGGEVGR